MPALIDRDDHRVRLRSWRRNLGLTQQSVADSLGWTGARYSRYEAGITGEISYDDMRNMMAITGLSYDAIQTRKGDNHGTDEQKRCAAE